MERRSGDGSQMMAKTCLREGYSQAQARRYLRDPILSTVLCPPLITLTYGLVFREAEDKAAKMRRAVRANNFTQQTNALDVDKHMYALPIKLPSSLPPPFLQRT